MYLSWSFPHLFSLKLTPYHNLLHISLFESQRMSPWPALVWLEEASLYVIILIFSSVLQLLCLTICILFECRAPVLEKASKSVWELILDNNGLGKEINEMVERVFCRLSGRESPLFPLQDVGTWPNKKNQNETGKELANESKEKENSPSASKKRNFSEMNAEGAYEAASRSGDPPTIPEESTKSPQVSLKT